MLYLQRLAWFIINFKLLCWNAVHACGGDALVESGFYAVMIRLRYVVDVLLHLAHQSLILVLEKMSRNIQVS